MVLALVGFVGLCLLVGATDTALLRNSGLGWYLSLKHPPGTPPDWLFAPVWARAVCGDRHGGLAGLAPVGAGAALRLLGLADRRQRAVDRRCSSDCIRSRSRWR